MADDCDMMLLNSEVISESSRFRRRKLVAESELLRFFTACTIKDAADPDTLDKERTHHTRFAGRIQFCVLQS
jgi:hypothetical protein